MKTIATEESLEGTIRYMFMHAFLKLMILYAIKVEKYPYAVVKKVQSHDHPMLGAIKKSDVYNQINSLEKGGLIRNVTMRDGKKYYELTKKGNYTLKKAGEIREKAFAEITKLIKGRF